MALLGEKAGGQVNDTATIENYLGMTQVGGSELAELFRNHLETYPVAERLHATVTKVGRRDDLFEVMTRDGRTYKGRTVIYAAGTQYRRLGVLGEGRFIGRGIAFCATCDAPLYRDKRVAMVGGGNSAFTAVRDLMSFAREIHVLHILDQFQADGVLVEEARKASNVTFHMKTEVREFLGGEHLSGVRVTAVDGSGRYDLLVDGVFLEIGLVANSDPVRDLVKLNGSGEIIVGRDQATDIPGLFAAGDATNERDKQIVIAAAAGARAAVAADRFLSELDVAVARVLPAAG